MRILFFVFTFLFIAVDSSAQKFKKKYKDQLEEGSKLLDGGFNFSLEKTKTGEFILKRYYPENRQLTEMVSAKTKRFLVKDGAYTKCYDDGTIVEKGRYSNDQKVGKWIESIALYGNYKDGLKNGQWINLRSDSTISRRMNYVDGQLDGESISYDSLGQISKTLLYEKGELISQISEQDSVWKVVEKMPLFPGCKGQGFSDAELKNCSNSKMLKYVYSTIRYPQSARQLGIQGTALVRFVIDKDGTVTDIEALNGVSRDIKAECIRLVTGMPKWIPGKQAGDPVKVYFNLPIKFRLQ